MTTETKQKKPMGLACVSPARRSEISRQGGIASHKRGTAHEWTREEASLAGKKGGAHSRRTQGNQPKREQGA